MAAPLVAADLPVDHPGPDLVQFLGADPSPTFLIPTHPTEPVAFEILLANAALKAIDGLESLICQEGPESIRFRSWVQASENWHETYDFAGRIWTAFSIQRRWKAVRASEKTVATTDAPVPAHSKSPTPGHLVLGSKDAHQVFVKLESLQRMMEMSDVGVFEYHPSGTLIRANESWYNLSLHPRELEAHSDFSFMDLVYPDDVPLVMSQWNQLSQGIPVTFEMRWKAPKTKDSWKNEEDEEESQWVLSACVPVMDDKGKLLSIAGNTIDISAQKRIQREALARAEALERARSSEQKFARFAEVAPVAIYIFDAKKGMQYCNHQFFELTGHPRVEPKDVDWNSLVHPEDLWMVEEGWRVLLEDKKPVQTQFRLRKEWDSGDGKLRDSWAQGSSHPECDAAGNVTTILGTLMDITRFKWVEDIQRIRVEEALEAKRQQENFIDMTSHEMRNPLSAVIQCADSSIDAIKQIAKMVPQPGNGETNEEKIQEEIRTSLDAQQTIISCSLHQKRVIDDILTLSKLDSNLILITPVPVQPVAVVTEAVKMFELECSKETIDLSLFQDQSLAAVDADWVMMDPSRVLQILINLLTNAIKFSRDRPVKRIKISLGASPTRLPQVWKDITFAPVRTVTQPILDKPEWGKGKKAYIWITVQDTGCGLSPTEQGHLFTRFSQATPRTHVRYGGSGLGLFISKSLTELQSGCIGVHSEAGVGSTFAFYVGTRLAALTPDELARLAPHPGEERRLSVEEAVKTAHYSVLIVEDNLINQKVLSRQLQKAGCEVYVAGHGEEALTFLKSTKFWHTQTLTGRELSMVLMDIEMPGMDGLTCSRLIREQQRVGEIVGHIPILAVSANARSEQINQAMEAGMDASIAKPFRIPELLTKMEMLAKGNK